MNGTCEFCAGFASRVNSAPESPFWIHVPTCPDCQAMVHAYREFQNPAGHGELAFDPVEADQELAARIDSALAQGPGENPHWWNRKELWYSTAAVLIVGAGLFLGQDFKSASGPTFNGASGFVRGDEPSPGQLFASWENGSLQVTTPELPEADQVRIVFYDGAMTELLSFTFPVGSPILIAPSPTLEESVFAQVFHLAQEDVLQRGPLFSIPSAP
jgi:hypothetical protein